MADPTAARSLIALDSSHLSQPYQDHPDPDLDLDRNDLFDNGESNDHRPLSESHPYAAKGKGKGKGKERSREGTSRERDGHGDEDNDDEDDDDDEWDRRRTSAGSAGARGGIYGNPSHARAGHSLDLDQSLELHDLEDSQGIPSSTSSPGLTKQEEARLRLIWWKNAAINVGFIGAWYCFSTLLSVYNKWMFSKDHYNFPHPLFVTSIHMLVQFLLSLLALSLFPSLRSPNRPDRKGYTEKVVPCGVATAMDIGLSNLSLRNITLSFYTMCKSSSLAFVLLFAFLFHLERPSVKLLGIILIITSGVILMVSTETQFDLVGMIYVLSASAMGGLRWSLTQILLDKKSMGMGNPIATLFWLAPIMGLSLAVTSMIVDGWGEVFGNESFFGNFGLGLWTMAVIFFPGVIAFLMNITEFGLIQRTSVVTLSVAGIFKEVAVIFLSMFIFHDQLTPINVSGLCVTIFGIGLYNYLKYTQFTNGEIDAHGGKKAAEAEDEEERTGIPIVEDSQEEGAPMLPVSKRSNDFSAAPLHSLGNSSDSDDSTSSTPRSHRRKDPRAHPPSSQSHPGRGRSSSISKYEQEDIHQHSLHRFSSGSKQKEHEKGRIEGLERMVAENPEGQELLDLRSPKRNGDRGREEEDWDLLGDGGGGDK